MNNDLLKYIDSISETGGRPTFATLNRPVLTANRVVTTPMIPVSTGSLILSNRWQSAIRPKFQLQPMYRVIDLTPQLPTINVGDYTLLPDTQNKKLYYVLTHPKLLNFSLNVYKQEVNNTIKITSGKALLEVELFTTKDKATLERMLINMEELRQYRSYRLLPLNISTLNAQFLSYSQQEVSAVKVSENRESASAVIEVTLTEVGALAWHNAIEQSRSHTLQGRCLFTVKMLTRNGNRTGTQTLQLGRNLGSLLRKVTMSQVTIINPTVTFNANIIVQSSSFIDNIIVDFKPSEGHAPESATCGAEGGEFAYKITTDDIEQLKIDIVYRITYQNARWPVVTVRKRLLGSDTDFSDIINPEAWLEQFTISVFQVNGTQVQDETGQTALTNRVMCQFIYNAPELGIIPINETIEPPVNTVHNIFFPRPPEVNNRTLQMTVFPMTNPDGIKFLQYTEDGLNSIIISAQPNGELKVSDNLNPVAESSWEGNLLQLLGEQHANDPTAETPTPAPPPVTGGFPVVAESSNTPEFQRLLRYLNTTEAEFAEYEAYYFYELEYALYQHGIFEENTYLDRYNYHNAVAEFQNRKRLAVDGLPGANTLWEMQFPLAQSANYSIQRVAADRVTGYTEGYNSFRLREDAAFYYEGLLDEVHSYGGVITSSGSLRALSANVTPGRSSKSMHYTGIAFDLFIHSGMRNPALDPFIVTQEGRKWRVYCRASGGEERTLQAVKWRGGRTTTETVEARVIDFTEIAGYYGFKRIGSRSCFPGTYGCSEWWHFQNEWVITPFFSQFGIEVLKLNTINLRQLQRSPLWTNRKKIYQRGWF